MATDLNNDQPVPRFSVGSYVNAVNKLAGTISKYAGKIVSEQIITDITADALQALEIPINRDTDYRTRLILSTFFGQAVGPRIQYMMAIALAGNASFIKTGRQLVLKRYPFRIIKAGISNQEGKDQIEIKVIWLTGPHSGNISTYRFPLQDTIVLLCHKLGIVWRSASRHSIRHISDLKGMLGYAKVQVNTDSEFLSSIVCSPGMLTWNRRLCLSSKKHLSQRIADYERRFQILQRNPNQDQCT